MEGSRCKVWTELERWQLMSRFASLAATSSASTTQTYNSATLFPTIFLHIRHGLTGEELLPTMESQAPDFAHNLVQWYIMNYDEFRPRLNSNDEEAQCRFHITTAQRKGIVPTNANRLILPTLLIETLSKLGLPPTGSSSQPEPIHLQLNLFWLQSMEECEVCGNKREGEYIPFYNCRFCGERPTMHHGKCCPKRGEDNLVHGDLRDGYSLQLLLQSVMDPERYERLERLHTREGLTSLSCGPLPFKRPPRYPRYLPTIPIVMGGNPQNLENLD